MQSLIHKNLPMTFLRLSPEESAVVELPLLLELISSENFVEEKRPSGANVYMRLTPEIDMSTESHKTSRRSSVEM
ncbi:hypothetical protein K7432_015916 [Basidiobolus ranarum]|uniref:Uncharacterized protein n=1 Tax=Basidiobolus ranarum TaxID=34480 RepID=A0ABR2VMD6_9FUNG